MMERVLWLRTWSRTRQRRAAPRRGAQALVLDEARRQSGNLGMGFGGDSDRGLPLSAQSTKAPNVTRALDLGLNGRYPFEGSADHGKESGRDADQRS
jgi:hypothetical protein